MVDDRGEHEFDHAKASGNTVTGFTIGTTTGYHIANTTTATVGSLTISNVTLNGAGGLFRALDLPAAPSAWTIDSLASTSGFVGNCIQWSLPCGHIYGQRYAARLAGPPAMMCRSTAGTATVSYCRARSPTQPVGLSDVSNKTPAAS